MQQMFKQSCQGVSLVQNWHLDESGRFVSPRTCFQILVVSLPLSRRFGTMADKTYKTKLLTVRLQPDELQVIRDTADRQGQTITALVREALAAAGVPVAA